MFISRRCYAVYDLRRQAPTTTTTRIPDPRTHLPPVGCPTSFFKEKNIRYKFLPFSLRPPFQLSRVYLRPSVLRCWRALLLTLCVLPFCIFFRIRTYGDSTYVHTSFLQSLSAYLHTAIPHTYIRRRLIHITIQSRSTNTRFTYVQSSTLFRSLILAFVY